MSRAGIFDPALSKQGIFDAALDKAGIFSKDFAPGATGLVAIVGQVVEVDFAQAVTWAPKLRIVAQIAETDLAQTLTARKTAGLGQATETDLRQAVARGGAAIVVAVGQALEADAAQIVTPVQQQQQPPSFTDGGVIGRRIRRRVAGFIGRARPWEERDV